MMMMMNMIMMMIWYDTKHKQIQNGFVCFRLSVSTLPQNAMASEKASWRRCLRMINKYLAWQLNLTREAAMSYFQTVRFQQRKPGTHQIYNMIVLICSDMHASALQSSSMHQLVHIIPPCPYFFAASKREQSRNLKRATMDIELKRYWQLEKPGHPGHPDWIFSKLWKVSILATFFGGHPPWCKQQQSNFSEPFQLPLKTHPLAPHWI